MDTQENITELDFRNDENSFSLLRDSLVRSEVEIAEGAGYTLAEVLAEADALIDTLKSEVIE